MGVWGLSPQRGSRGQSPRWGSGVGEAPEADEVFVFKTVIFNVSATCLHEMMYGYCLSCFFCAQVYGFTVRICSLAIAGQHLSIIRQVHVLCLGLTGRLREKTGHHSFLPHSLPFPFPPSRPLPFHPLPPLRSRPLKST